LVFKRGMMPLREDGTKERSGVKVTLRISSGRAKYICKKGLGRKLSSPAAG